MQLPNCQSPGSPSSLFCKELFNFVVERKTTRLGLRKDYPTIDHHIELAGLTRLDLHLLAEAGVQRRGQTGRAWLISSDLTVENFRCHNGKGSARLRRSQQPRFFKEATGTGSARLLTPIGQVDKDCRRHY